MLRLDSTGRTSSTNLSPRSTSTLFATAIKFSSCDRLWQTTQTSRNTLFSLWFLKKQKKKWACLQGSPTKNPKTQHDAELSCKNEVERSIHSGDILRNKTEIGPKLKNQNCSTAWNNSINLLFLWMSTQKQKTSIISLFCLNANLILEIFFGTPECAWPHPYEQIDVFMYFDDWCNHAEVFMNAWSHAKNKIQTYGHFLRYNWPVSLEMIKQICNFYGTLTVCQKPAL